MDNVYFLRACQSSSVVDCEGGGRGDPPAVRVKLYGVLPVKEIMRGCWGQVYHPDCYGLATEKVAPRVFASGREQILSDLSPGVTVHRLVEALADSGSDGDIVSQCLGHFAGGPTVG